jgi:hypothetical protein
MKDIEIEGPSDNFSKTGKYKVTYSAENSDKKTVSKTVDVIIMDGLVPGDSEEGVNVYAQYIALSKDELSTLTKEDIISKSKAQSIYYKRNDKNILTELDDITSLINVKTNRNLPHYLCDNSSFWTASPFRTVTLASNYKPTPRNIPEERIPLL